MLSYLSLQGPQRLMMTMCKVVRMRRRMLCLLKNSHQTNGSSMKCQGRTMSFSLDFRSKAYTVIRHFYPSCFFYFCLFIAVIFGLAVLVLNCTPMPKLKLSKLNQTRRVAHGHANVPLSWKLGLQQYCIGIFFYLAVSSTFVSTKWIHKESDSTFLTSDCWHLVKYFSKSLIHIQMQSIKKVKPVMFKKFGIIS